MQKLRISMKSIIVLVNICLGSNIVLSMDYVKKFNAYLNPKLKQFEKISQPMVKKIIDFGIQLLKPNYEMSADILGAIAADYQKLASAGAQWFLFENPSIDDICSEHYTFKEINHDTVKNRTNILCRDGLYDDHPGIDDRVTILLQLSTMIKAAVDFLVKQKNLQCYMDQSDINIPLNTDVN